jgi:ATP synthase F1 gamma subunit
MPTIKQIDQIIEEDNSLKIIAQAYSEIANQKVKKIRLEAERNRLFLEEIGKSYALIKLLAQKRKVSVAKPKACVTVLITSNNRFYGTIDSDLIKFYTNQTKAMQTDRIVIGKMGIEHFKTEKTFGNMEEVVLKSDMPTPEELKQLTELIHDHNQVLVFYSQLKSLLVQVPMVLDLTQSQSVYSPLADESKFRFIFEPQLPQVLSFFDSQVANLILEGTFLESEAARTASRFISMDQAQSSADKMIREYEKVRAYTKRNLENNLILENFASTFGRKI